MIVFIIQLNCAYVQIDRSPMTIVENNEPKPVAERLLFIIVARHC